MAHTRAERSAKPNARASLNTHAHELSRLAIDASFDAKLTREERPVTLPVAATLGTDGLAYARWDAHPSSPR